MITVLIQANDDGEALSRSLVPLVEGAMEGVISNVLVFSNNEVATLEIERICDLSGAEHCKMVDTHQRISNAKDKWVLILEAGARLEVDWLNGVMQHMNKTQKIGRFALAERASGKPWWRNLFGDARKNSALERGCLMPKNAAINASKNASDLQALARGRSMIVIDGGRIRPALI